MFPCPRLLLLLEHGLRYASIQSAEVVCHRVIGVLPCVKPPPTNVTVDKCSALKELWRDDLMILPADKGCATVLLDRLRLMTTWIVCCQMWVCRRYWPGSNNSFVTENEQCSFEFEEKRFLPERLYDQLRCSSGTTPFIYSLPKIHKANIPQQTMVSFST